MFVRPSDRRADESGSIDIDAISAGSCQTFQRCDCETYPIFSADRVAPRINWNVRRRHLPRGLSIPHLHRKTIAPYFSAMRHVDAAGLHGRMCVARTSIDAVRPLPEGERNYRPHVISIYQLFPNTILIWQVDHIEIWRAFPDRDDASRSDVEMTIYKPQDSDRSDAYWEKNRDIATSVRDEGFPLSRMHSVRIRRTEEVISAATSRRGSLPPSIRQALASRR